MQHFTRMVRMIVVVCVWWGLTECEGGVAPQDGLVVTPGAQPETGGPSFLFVLPPVPSTRTPVMGEEYYVSSRGEILSSSVHGGGNDGVNSDTVTRESMGSSNLSSDIAETDKVPTQNSGHETELETFIQNNIPELDGGDETVNNKVLIHSVGSPHRGVSGRQLFNQNTNRFSNNRVNIGGESGSFNRATTNSGNQPSGAVGGHLQSNRIIGSSPGAAVSMVQSFVEDMTTRPTGERPGYIMINSPNPALIQQLVTSLTHRYGSGSVIQEPGAIQNLVNSAPDTGNSRIQNRPHSSSSSSNKTPTLPLKSTISNPYNDKMPMFPYKSYWSKSEEASRTTDSEVDYIRQHLASIAHITVSTGHLVNYTMVDNTAVMDTAISDGMADYTLVNITSSSSTTLDLTSGDATVTSLTPAATQPTLTTISPIEFEPNNESQLGNAITDFDGNVADTAIRIVTTPVSTDVQINKDHQLESEYDTPVKQHSATKHNTSEDLQSATVATTSVQLSSESSKTTVRTTGMLPHVDSSHEQSVIHQQLSNQSFTEESGDIVSQGNVAESLLVNKVFDQLSQYEMEDIEPLHYGEKEKKPVVPAMHNTSLSIYNNTINPSGIYTKNVFLPDDVALSNSTQREPDDIATNLSDSKQTFSTQSDVQYSSSIALTTAPPISHKNTTAYITTTIHPTTYTSTIDVSIYNATSSIPMTDDTQVPSETSKIHSIHGDYYHVPGFEASPQNSITADYDWENGVSTTGYEDYYEEIDGELVLSPFMFMRRGGPQMMEPEDYSIQEDDQHQENRKEYVSQSQAQADALDSGQADPATYKYGNKFPYGHSEYLLTNVNIPQTSGGYSPYPLTNLRVTPNTKHPDVNKFHQFGEGHNNMHRFAQVNRNPHAAMNGDYVASSHLQTFQTSPQAPHHSSITAEDHSTHQLHQLDYEEMGPIDPHLLEELWRTNSEGLSRLDLLQAMDRIPVVYNEQQKAEENDISSVPSLLSSVSPNILNYLHNLKVVELETLGLQKHLKNAPAEDVNGLHPVAGDHSKLYSMNQGIQRLKENENVTQSSSTNSILEPPAHSNFSSGNYRQSNPAQTFPPNFFPARPTEVPDPQGEGHPHHHHHQGSVQLEVGHSSQLTSEQQDIISRLPAGMQHVVSAIVQAVNAPIVAPSTTSPPQQQPFQFNYPLYPYLPYPYYPPPPLSYPYTSVPAPQPNQGSDTSRLHNPIHDINGNHGVQVGHSAPGHHGTHGHHSTHDHESHAAHNHGTHQPHNNHGSQNVHDNYNYHGHNHFHSDNDRTATNQNRTPDGVTRRPGAANRTPGSATRRPGAPNRTPGSGTRRPGNPSRTDGSNRRQPVVPNYLVSITPQPVVVTQAIPTLNPSIGASRLGEFDSSGIPDIEETGIRENDNRQGGVNRIGPRQPDRNQGLLNLRQDASQMGHGRPSGGGIVNYRPPQQSQMHMGQPVINVVLPETPGPNQDSSAGEEEEEEIGPLIDLDEAQDDNPDNNNIAQPQGMDREEVNSLLQSLFSSPTLLLLGIIFAMSAAYMAIAMEEQSAQQQFQQAQLAAAFGGQPFFPPGRRKRRRRSRVGNPDASLVWYPTLPLIVNN